MLVLADPPLAASQHMITMANAATTPSSQPRTHSTSTQSLKGDTCWFHTATAENNKLACCRSIVKKSSVARARAVDRFFVNHKLGWSSACGSPLARNVFSCSTRIYRAKVFWRVGISLWLGHGDISSRSRPNRRRQVTTRFLPSFTRRIKKK